MEKLPELPLLLVYAIVSPTTTIAEKLTPQPLAEPLAASNLENATVEPFRVIVFLYVAVPSVSSVSIDMFKTHLFLITKLSAAADADIVAKVEIELFPAEYEKLPEASVVPLHPSGCVAIEGIRIDWFWVGINKT